MQNRVSPAHPQGKSQWPLETAGHRMTANVPTATMDQTLEEVATSLRRNIDHFSSLNYVYVLDGEHRFVGVLSMRDLYRLPQKSRVGEVCKRHPLVEMKPTTHQERAAYLALQHNIKAVPVVDHRRVFLGVVPADAILTILHKEMQQDMLKLSGVRHPSAFAKNIFQLSLGESYRHRILWLLVGLGGGIFSARIIGFFETTLQENLTLAMFIPLIVYMSDAVGTQMEAYIIRDLALEGDLPFLRYFARQLAVVFMLAVTFGVILAAAGTLFLSARVAFVLGVSLMVAVLSSVFTGLLVPYLFKRVKLDPADAGGPVATILQDILSIVIYFGVASVLL